MNPAYKVVQPLYVHTQPLNITTVNGTSADGVNIRVSDDFDFLVRHIDVTAFHQGGALNENDDTRDLILVDIAKSSGGIRWFSEPLDIFALRRLTASNAFQPVLLKQGEQLTFTAQHSNFVAGAGSPFTTAPIRVYVHLFGQKVTFN